MLVDALIKLMDPVYYNMFILFFIFLYIIILITNIILRSGKTDTNINKQKKAEVSWKIKTPTVINIQRNSTLTD